MREKPYYSPVGRACRTRLLSTAVSSSKTYKAGDTVTVTYVRSGKVYTTELTFGSTLEKPQDPKPQSAQSQQELPEGCRQPLDFRV